MYRIGHRSELSAYKCTLHFITDYAPIFGFWGVAFEKKRFNPATEPVLHHPCQTPDIDPAGSGLQQGLGGLGRG
jgi:hypothetical protein